MSPKTAAQALPAASPAEDSFYIAATLSASRPRRSLKHNDTFIVLDTFGDMGASAGGTDGLFYHDTRFLSRLQLLVNDAAAVAGLKFARRQRSARRRSHQSRHFCGSARRSWRRIRCTSCAPFSCGGTPPISGSACAITAIGRSRCACRSCSPTTLPIFSRSAALVASDAAPRPRNCAATTKCCSTTTASTTSCAARR